LPGPELPLQGRGRYATRAGSRFPPGPTLTAEGVNFSVFSRTARHVALLLYEAADSPEPFQIITLDAEENRSFYFWHVFVESLPAGTHYTWRVNGGKELVDPWAPAVTDAVWDRARATAGETRVSFRGVIPEPMAAAPRARRTRPGLEGAVIYEMHVGLFTRHPSSRVQHPGTFAGLMEKIPYLKELGVTHVELLPVMAFDEQHVPAGAAARGLHNVWGYSTHSFHSPHPHYCVTPRDGTHGREFRALVDALHRAGIDVILDAVFNHTAEGGSEGPVINLKGLADDIAYHRDPADPRRYRDFTGCGNTVNCNHPLVTRYIVRCLEYWAEEMGVDGFRFDLASVFVRGEDGEPMADPPLPWAIEFSSSLAGLPLIAEAWDAAGLYHVGAFPGMAWAEWNGHFRDTMRRFVRGDRGLTGEVAMRIAGSSDLYADDGRLPANSINFITCHDGFTLYDLVSYDRKHNEANGGENGDGTNDNLSWNCGVEGETDAPQVGALRRRQARNFIAILMLSRGVPMLLAGDEVMRTQRGNNNAWCQDNELSWFDWRAVDRERDMLAFVRGMIALRRRHPSLTANRFFSGEPIPHRGVPDIAWHGRRLNEPPWHDRQAQCLAFTIAGRSADEADLHVVLNMSDEALEAPLPKIAGRCWHCAVDTSDARGVFAPSEQHALDAAVFSILPRSVVVLEARPLPGGMPRA
jgi:isoamylase